MLYLQAILYLAHSYCFLLKHSFLIFLYKSCQLLLNNGTSYCKIKIRLKARTSIALWQFFNRVEITTVKKLTVV